VDDGIRVVADEAVDAHLAERRPIGIEKGLRQLLRHGVGRILDLREMAPETLRQVPARHVLDLSCAGLRERAHDAGVEVAYEAPDCPPGADERPRVQGLLPVRVDLRVALLAGAHVVQRGQLVHRRGLLGVGLAGECDEN
jgi:hypothetical protein